MTGNPDNYAYGVRFRPLYAAAAALAALSLLIVGGVVLGVRAANSDYACLSFASDLAGRNWLLDLTTGSATYDARPLDAYPAEVSGNWQTPDGARIAYLRPDLALPYRHALFVAPLRDGLPEMAAEVRIAERLSITAFGWSADSARLAYIWRDEVGQGYLTIAAPDGSAALTRSVPTTRSAEIQFYGWSADSAFLATSINDIFGRVVTFWALPDLRAASFPLYTILPFIEHYAWSPRGHQLAYLRSDLNNPTRTRLVIAAPEVVSVAAPTGGTEIALDLPYRSNARLLWSPDGQFVALRYNDAVSQWFIAIYDVTGDEPQEVALFRQGSRLLWPQGAAWSADSRALSFWRERLGGGRDLAAYDVISGGQRTLIANVTVGNHDPLAPRNGLPPTRLALAYRAADGTLAVDVMDMDATNRTTIVTGAAEVNDVLWSPAGDLILVRSATRARNLRPQPSFTWATPEGTVLGTAQADDGQAQATLWLPGQKRLAYISQERRQARVAVLDLEAGQARMLAEGLDEVRGLEFVATGETLRFWWRVGGQIGVDAYRLDGARLYRFGTRGTAIPGDVYPAPEGARAALFVGPTGAKSLLLVSADGTLTRTLRSGDAWSGAPAWSPNGELLAHAYRDQVGREVIEIFTADGQSVRRFDQFRRPYEGLTWTRCG